MRSTALILSVTIPVVGCTSQSTAGNSFERGTEAVNKATESEEYVVKYTESGFVPHTLLIQEGDTIRWIDRSDTKQMEIISTRGKPCSNGSGFGSCKNVENYSHTFTGEGTYDYYNDRERSDRGIIELDRKIT